LEEIAVVVDTNFVIAIIFEDHIFSLAIENWGKILKAYLPIIAVSELAYFLIKTDLIWMMF